MKYSELLFGSLLILGGVLLTGTAIAQSTSVVLTPTALYEMIEKEQSARRKLTHVCQKLNARVNELEHIASGLEYEVTVLHAKLNVVSGQAAADQDVINGIAARKKVGK